MLNNARKKMLERVKAILAKTMENGCSEAEAMTALAKARELMATYEIDEKELDAFDRESVNIHKTKINDPYEIKSMLGTNVGKFTRCQAWNGAKSFEYGIAFAGLESDVIFATWLLDTLQRFVMRALRDHQKKLIAKGSYHSNNLTSASFVMGCINRINEKLKELTPIDYAKNKELIAAEMAKNGIALRKSRKDERNVDAGSFKAGQSAGSNARFDKPVGAGGRRMLK
jgi:hypothetical protein